jgi:cytochrome b subunit of formate dehydrogenase
MMPANRVRVLRHTRFWRTLHWAIFLGGAFEVLTGMQRGGMLPSGMAVFPSNTFSYHAAVGILFIGASILVGYEMIVTGSYSWVAIRRIPLSLRYIANETKAWFGISPPMREPILYSQTKQHYEEKVIPSVISVWWAFVVLGWVLVATGLALTLPTQFSFLYRIVDPVGILLTGVGGYAFMAAVHRLAMEFLVLLVILHIYASFLFKLVQSSIFGYREEPAM